MLKCVKCTGGSGQGLFPGAIRINIGAVITATPTTTTTTITTTIITIIISSGAGGADGRRCRTTGTRRKRFDRARRLSLL